MNTNDTLINFADLYGITNGLFIASAISTFLFALSFVVEKNQRQFSLLFFMASFGFLLLCSFNMYFQSFHFEELSEKTYPDFILFIGKISAPIIISIFSYLFVSQTSMVSKTAYDLIDKYKLILYMFHGLNLLTFIVLFFIESAKTVSIITFGLFSIQYLAATIYLRTGLGHKIAGKFFAMLCLVTFFIYLMIIVLIIYGFENLPKQMIFSGHILLSVVTVVVSFLCMHFGYEQVYKFDSVARGQNRQLINHINNALKNDEFFMVYQPKLDIHEDKICGVEALIRWNSPKLGFVRPDQFIPVAESTHLIDSICDWVVVATAKQARAFADAGYNMPISINFSVKNLKKHNVEFFLDVMKQYDLKAGDLIIEVTETVFMENNEDEKEALTMLNDHGIPLSLDDYGTGYSSLTSINQLALSELKIDRSFVSDLEENHEHHIIVSSTLRMSKELGVKVVAEGVEEIEIIEKLKEMHCDIVQGYGIAKPMKADDMLTWLRSSGYHYSRKQTVTYHEKHSLKI